MDSKSKTLFTESDFVDVYDGNGVKLDPVPQSWLGTDLLPEGVTDKGPKTPDAPVSIPEGEPTVEWTVPQIDKYAADNSVSLGEAKKKDDKLPLIVAHFQAAQTPA